MVPLSQPGRRVPVALAIVLALTLALSSTVAAVVTLLQISSDPFTNSTSQHQTQVEPDMFSAGSTIVSAFQSGRFTDGGSSDIGWATSQDGGTTWTKGFLPSVTTFSKPPGPFARVSDTAVAFDAKDNVWLIVSLPLNTVPEGAGVIVNRSTDGGLTFGNPVTVSTQLNSDKSWIVCDNTSTSAFFGHCYVEWDAHGSNNLVQMSTSTDGGLTWGAAKTTANNASVIGGQPLVQPNGNVIVPIDNGFETSLLSFMSTNGGASWSATKLITSLHTHTAAGGLRTSALPSAGVDAAGDVFVVFQDCRFETNCSANDLVMTASKNGTTWSPVKRIPIDPVGSGVDHFIPGLAVDKSTSGATAHLGLAFYFYPTANCTASTCQLDVGFVSSTNGGQTWTAKQQLAGPMQLSWLANTTQGRMVGDYISTSFVNGKAFPVFAVATAPTSGGSDCKTATPNCNEAMFTVMGGLAAEAGDLVASDAGAASPSEAGSSASSAPAKQQ